MKVLAFKASWCKPCQAMIPTIEQLQQITDVEVVDIEEQSNIRAEYNIRSIPSFVLVNEEGAEVDRRVGSATYTELKDWFEKNRG